MEWNQTYSEMPMVAVGSRYGRCMCATDAAGVPKQHSAVAYVVVASLQGRQWWHWASVLGAVSSWYERRTDTQVVVE